MESKLDGEILLLGEANFSFSLSLLKLIPPEQVTTSCYESKEEAIIKYGTECVTNNLKELYEKGCKRVLYQIDACNLKGCFSEGEKFERIIFMFPHVGGKSNLKKNRELLDNFFRSARDILHIENNNRPSIFITLAKGQGGTSFEEDPKKRNVKDCWQVLNIAQNNGYILTECSQLDESKFPVYKSTGFRSQAKSFQTKSGLVHRFELSLPIVELNEGYQLNNFLGNELYEQKEILNPMIQLKQVIIARLMEKLSKTSVNLFSDTCDLNFSKEFKNFVSSKSKSLQKSLLDNLDELKSKGKIKPDCLNVLSGLVLKKTNIGLSLQSIPRMDCINYEILLSYSISDSYIKTVILSTVLGIIENKISENKELLSHETLVSTDVHSNEIVTTINVSLLLRILFGIYDERLLFSNDSRIYIEEPSEENECTVIIKPYSIENPKWRHDISFWFDEESFNIETFLDSVRNNCFGLVTNIEVLDIYIKEGRQAACLKMEYQSCDRALSWQDSLNLQLRFRNDFSNFKGVTLR